MTVIEMKSVHKRFGDVVAVDGIDLSVDRGELVAVLGPNGAGKTTVFELILGLTTSTSGEVRTLGRRPGDRHAVLRTGTMLQSAGLPEHVTVTELVRLVAASYPRPLPVEETLERVGLRSRGTRMVTVLSGGERQRLLLAMAIVGSPELLLLDEPTAAMDPEARRAFWTEARAAVDEGTTLVFATHDLAEADAVARRVIVLRSGRVLADTTPAHMKGLVAPKTVTLRTDAPPEVLTTITGGGHVEVDGEAGSLRIHTPAPEKLVAEMVERGHTVEDLVISEADLEDAFVTLLATGEERS